MSMFNDDRVALEPAPAKSGDTVHVKYYGLLKNSGADNIYLHYGSDGWQNSHTVEMNHSHEGVFAAEIPAHASGEVNFCFKDSANNWDNNNGWNWKIEVFS